MYSSFLLPLRRTLICASTLVVVLSLLPSLVRAQTCGGVGIVSKVTNSGQEFLVCFMQNEEETYDQAISLGGEEFQDIYLASVDPVNTTTVTITCLRYPAVKQVITLPPHASQIVHVIGLPTITDLLPTPPKNGPPYDGIINTWEQEDSTVFKVIADNPIVCYGMNSKTFTADAFISLPINVASTEYHILSYACLLYTSPSPRDRQKSRMPSSA